MNFFCDMTALTAKQRDRHGVLAKALRPKVIEFKELENGYSAIFPLNFDNELTEFGQLEKLCCPFFETQLSSQENMSVLTITGEGDIKPFIRAEFGISQF